MGALLCGTARLHAQRAGETSNSVEHHRLRYTQLQWQAFHTPTFHLYFPRGYDSIAAFVSRELPAATALLSRRLGAALAKEPQLIIYPSARHQQESNIGRSEPTALAFPTFIKKGSRLVLAYDGSYQKLKDALYTVLARSIWETQFPSTLGQQAKGINNEDVPFWYKEGAIAYFATGWRPEDEDQVQALLKDDTVLVWDAFAQTYPALAGRALHYYLSQAYFPEAPQGLYFQVRAKKSLRRGMRLLAKRPLDTVLAQCLHFYWQRSEALAARGDNQGRNTALATFRKPAGIVKEWLVQPDGKAFVLLTEHNNQRNLLHYEQATGKAERLFSYRLPPWLQTHDSDPYPLFAFEGTDLWAIVPYKGRIELRRYSPSGTKLTSYILRGIDGVSSILPLGKQQFLLAAYRRGQSDLVVFDGARGRYTPLTNDAYDDRAPILQGADAETVVFKSARPDKRDTSDTAHLYHGLYRLERRQPVAIITDTLPFVHWTPLAWLDSRRLLASTTRSGTSSLATIEPENPQALAQLHSGTTNIRYVPGVNAIATLTQKGDSLVLRTEPLQQWLQEHRRAENDATSPWLRDYRKVEALRASEDSILRAARDTTPSFLSGVLSSESDKAGAQKRKDSLAELSRFRPQKAKPYILQLYSAYFSARLSTDYFINRYQPYQAYLGQFKFPEVGGLARGGYSDLFENHHISLAYRLPSGTEGSDFFINYRNTARRVEWGLTYFRKVESLRPDPVRRWRDKDDRLYPGAAKVKTHYYELSLRRPLSYDATVGLETALRKDRTIFLATDRYSLTFPSLESLWLLNTLSASLDRRRPVSQPGLYKGYSGKVFLDIFKGFGEEESTALALRAKAEHHQPLYKGITLVGKVQGGYSAGDARVLYNTGGVDGALNPKVDSSVQFSQDAPYAFQTLSTPLRGYAQNSLFGDRYALLNAEVWVPLFGELIPLETPLPSINGLQVGVFSDGAIAKEGWRRGGQSSLLWSFGWSARTTLAGYPVHLDTGWPGTFGKKPLWYLSISTQ